MLSEAKHLCLLLGVLSKKGREILRFAQNDKKSIKPRNAPGHVSGGNADDSLQRARTLERVRLG